MAYVPIPMIAKGRIGPYYWGYSKRARGNKERWGISPTGAFLEYRWPNGSKPLYTPGEAVAFIKKRAREGSELHQEALEVAACLKLSSS